MGPKALIERRVPDIVAAFWRMARYRRPVSRPSLALTRDQILAFRRNVGALDKRLPPGSESLRCAAWAGLQDSMPRAALLSIHARVEATEPGTWEDPSLVQLWGPRFSAYLVAAEDRAVFTLGRLPEAPAGRRRALTTADRLAAHLGGRRMTYAEAGRALGVNPNMLRYAAPTGRVLIRWDGARQPVIWMAPPPEMDPRQARRELVRRYLRVFGPGTPAGFGRWAGVRPAAAQDAFEGVADSTIPVRTPIGDAWILESDEAPFRAARRAPAEGVRLLPSGDAYYLLQGSDRELLVEDPARRGELWTSRVWPGAVLAGGEIVGTWRRADATVAIRTWHALAPRERDAVAAEAVSLPLPGLAGQIRVAFET
jgi:winged helix DNA-binding protein